MTRQYAHYGSVLYPLFYAQVLPTIVWLLENLPHLVILELIYCLVLSLAPISH